MSDRIKKTNEDSKTDLDRAFLEKNQVKETMKELLWILASNQPQDPLQFMADYFRSTYEDSSRMVRGYQTLMLAHYSRPAFQRNLMSAFEILSKPKEVNGSVGLNGSLFNELLDLLLRDIPQNTQPKFKAKLSRRPYEAVSYETFAYSVNCLMILKDYLSMAKEMFKLLDVSEIGQIEKAYAEALLSHLNTSLRDLNNEPLKKIQGCYSLSPDNLFILLSKIKKSSKKQFVELDEFIDLTLEGFLPLIQNSVVRSS